jgi:hypothetical protein
MNTPPEHGTVQIDGVPRPALIFPLTLDGLRRKNLGLAIWLVPLIAFAVIYLILLIRIGTYTDATSNLLRIFVLAMEGLFIAIGVWLIRTWRKPGFVALLREGVYSRTGSARFSFRGRRSRRWASTSSREFPVLVSARARRRVTLPSG